MNRRILGLAFVIVASAVSTSHAVITINRQFYGPTDHLFVDIAPSLQTQVTVEQEGDQLKFTVFGPHWGGGEDVYRTAMPSGWLVIDGGAAPDASVSIERLFFPGLDGIAVYNCLYTRTEDVVGVESLSIYNAHLAGSFRCLFDRATVRAEIMAIEDSFMNDLTHYGTLWDHHDSATIRTLF